MTYLPRKFPSCPESWLAEVGERIKEKKNKVKIEKWREG
jgi:hypothetical protein